MFNEDKIIGIFCFTDGFLKMSFQWRVKPTTTGPVVHL